MITVEGSCCKVVEKKKKKSVSHQFLFFAGTIKESTFCAAQVNDSGQVRIRNPQLSADEDVIFPTSLLMDHSSSAAAVETLIKTSPLFSRFGRWPLYVVGVLWWLESRRKALSGHGLTLFISSSVPLGKGVSSSASVEVAVMMAAANALKVSELSGLEVATACQVSEERKKKRSFFCLFL